MKRVSRRTFCHGTVAAGAALSFPIASHRAYGANDRFRMAVIGLNGRGTDHLHSLAKHVVAVCDCDQAVLGVRADDFDKTHGVKVDRYVDYRSLLERKDIDAVSIATPNHTHALIAITAMAAGKHVYCEKPVSHNVWEGRQIVNASLKYDKVCQAGTQSRSSPSLMEAVTYVQNGKLGAIQYALGTCYKPRTSIGKLAAPLPMPASLDYDLWCGPADKVPLYRPKLHYDWHWDFNTGSGDMGNQGIHQMDIARWFLGEGTIAPRTISIGGRFGYEDAGDTPNTQVVYHAYPKAPLIFETRGLPKSKEAQKNWGKSMDTYRGSQVGVIVQCENGYVVIPSYTAATAFDNDGQQLQAWNGGGYHSPNFVDAAKPNDRRKLHADILEGHISSALCHTGNLSHQVGQPATLKEITDRLEGSTLLVDSFQRMAEHLRANAVDVEGTTLIGGPWLEFDVDAERVKGSDRANALMKREGRGSFIIPDLS